MPRRPSARSFAVVIGIVAIWCAGCSGGPSPQPSQAPQAADARDPSGIPLSLGGSPVRIGLAAVAHAASATSDAPFLVGGWFNDAMRLTCSGAGGIGRDPSPLLTGCGTNVGSNSPWASTFPGPQGHMFWDGHELPGNRGPSIVRAHTRDARAADCRPDSRAACAAVLVVEEVIWTGDAWTTTSPVSILDAVELLGALNIQTDVQTGPQEFLSITRDLFVTPFEVPCSGPWPHAVFELHGDPRFGLLAVFPDSESRAAAQAALDPSNPDCELDPRIERPGAAAWAGDRNVLALVFADDARVRMQAALDGSIDRDRYLGFPPDDLDESYRVVDDALAARADGNLDGYPLLPVTAPEGAAYIDDVLRRLEADALGYAIGEGRPVAEADLGALLWAEYEDAIAPGTGTLYVVDHPNSSDPALTTERILGFKWRQPSVDTWAILVLPPP